MLEPPVLNTGRTIPPIGFGTWEIKPNQAAKKAVLAALKAGYRLIDTAKIYGNEQGVGEAIRESGIPREEVFVTTKLWNDDQGYNRTLEACRTSLQNLGLDYLDLYLIHWPASTRRHPSWDAMKQLKEEGLILDAGVSNYTIDHLRELQERSDMVPAVNQVEFHPFIYEQQRELLIYCAGQGIVVEAYSPLSRMAREPHQAIHNIAREVGKTPQQVVLRWCIQHGTVPLPRSTNPRHIEANLQIFDFELSDAHMKVLNSLSDGERITWDPEGMG
ncbi:MAG: Aldo/keto reductase family [Candidatus Saccharibacteria bacterium]|nr:Aldo/keto reductase family [Candidatus Saccharibacteria bacterium]